MSFLHLQPSCLNEAVVPLGCVAAHVRPEAHLSCHTSVPKIIAVWRRTTLISSSSSEYVQPINLPKTSLKDWMLLTHTGWGKTARRSGVRSFSVLQVATTKAMDKSLCKIYFPRKDDSFICVSSTQRTTACKGDSGGPYVYEKQLFGITSFGIKGCEPNYPHAIVNVFHFNGWIKNVMASSSVAKPLLSLLFFMLVANIVVLKLW
ncbi:brachyurin-like [Penaeus japonicus]|uniref:brachyurin-like n=1 Tax=Penaeus japonicus TaxID=27405 RepID=UPI001C71559A|nr:brachyurin-like [Penaeus japonicus]